MLKKFCSHAIAFFAPITLLWLASMAVPWTFRAEAGGFHLYRTGQYAQTIANPLTSIGQEVAQTPNTPALQPTPQSEPVSAQQAKNAAGPYNDSTYDTAHEVNVSSTPYPACALLSDDETVEALKTQPAWRLGTAGPSIDNQSVWLTLYSEPDASGQFGIFPCVEVSRDFLPQMLRIDEQGKLVPTEKQ